MVSKAHRGMIHIPRGGGGQRPPYYGGPPSRTPFPPRDRYLPMPFPPRDRDLPMPLPPRDRRPRPPYYGGGRPMPPFFGYRPNPYENRPPFFGGGRYPPFFGGGYGGGYPFRPPFGANPFNPFRPRPHSKALQALLQAQREKFNEATIGRPNKNPLNINMTQPAVPMQGIAQAVPMQVAELSSSGPATTTVALPPPPRRPRIAVDPVRRRRMYPSVVRNKGGLMKRRHA